MRKLGILQRQVLQNLEMIGRGRGRVLGRSQPQVLGSNQGVVATSAQLLVLRPAHPIERTQPSGSGCVIRDIHARAA